MRNRSHLLFTVVLGVVCVAAPARGQSSDEFWRNRWFWGAQAGGFLYSAGGSTKGGVGMGGHWFITSGRSALSLSFNQLFLSNSSVALSTGEQVNFDAGQVIQATVYALPATDPVRIYLGGGFAIHHITNAAPVGSFGTPQLLAAAEERIEQLATKAFAVLSGGAQYRVRGRWVVFGQYQFMPSANDFLVTSGQHLIQGGVRFALADAKEEVTTER